MSPVRNVCSCVILVAALVPCAAAQDTRPVNRLASGISAPLLDVPFVPQTEALCGGAAVAMVFRYWSAAPVFAEDFAPLVDESAEGIPMSVLSRAITDRGWRASPFSATAADVQGHLTRGRPVITLIEDRPGRYHYVVVVAWTNDRVVLHDPAYGPFRVVDVAKFERAWAVTNHASLLVLPSGERPSASGSIPITSREPANACSEPLEEAVRLARQGDLQNAEALLDLAGAACPGDGRAHGELAGIRFLQRRWTDAADLAGEAVARDPSNMHAWQLLATSRYLQGDTIGALRAWNRREEPRVDLPQIDGLDRVPHDVVANRLDLAPYALLTDRALARARRRVAAIPALHATRVGYTPRPDGRATVDVAVVERPLVPRNWPSVAVMGAHAAIAREIRFETANATGHGELWTAAWRWWALRPRVSVALAAPRLGGATGLWRVEGSWERQSYRPIGAGASHASIDSLTTSERRRANVAFGDWASGDLRWEVNGGLDRWEHRGNYLTAGAAVEHRLLSDRLAMRADGTAWREAGGEARAFGSSSVSLAWRSASERSQTWSMKAGVYGVTPGAPRDLWPAADTGHARPLLLRAHPLLHDGAIRSSDLSRVLVHGTFERQQSLSRRPPAPLAWALFGDVARRIASADAGGVTHVDIGAGLRVDLPGTKNVLRLDVARGLRDGRTALSIGWNTEWPGW